MDPYRTPTSDYADYRSHCYTLFHSDYPFIIALSFFYVHIVCLMIACGGLGIGVLNLWDLRVEQQQENRHNKASGRVGPQQLSDHHCKAITPFVAQKLQRLKLRVLPGPKLSTSILNPKRSLAESTSCFGAADCW